jgi:two-component system cell cycle sensor histidine kinase/response regulator CckA
MTPSQILVVEDEAIIAEDIEDTLKELGYGVAGTASSAEQAIQKVARTHPDLVLMDIRLPGIKDGIDAAQQIFAHFRTPLVYLTGHTDAVTLDRAKTTEPLGYLLKPFSGRELHAVVEIALYKHRMERKLRESEQRFATTLRSIGNAVIATDRQGMITFLNPAAEALTRWGRQEALGKDLSEVFRIISEETRHPTENPVTKAIQEDRVVALADYTLLIDRDGTERPIADIAAPIKEDTGQVTGAVLVFHDMTEHRNLERKLAGGIAHDFNNLMTVVLGNSALLLKDARQPADARAMLEGIKNAGKRAAALTTQLLTFSREQLLVPAVLDSID